MVVNERYPITIVLKDHGADFDLAPWLEDIEYEETGNEEISNATIILNQHFGRFNIQGLVIGNNTFPKIEFFDRIFFRFTDPNGKTVEDVVQVLKFKPDEAGGTGNTLTLLTEHQGFHFFRMHNLKQYQRESGFDVISDNGSVYSSSDVRGVNQPSMENHNTPMSFTGPKPVGNAASQATYIDFDFKDAEFFIGDGINVVGKRLGASVEAGGELEFFDWRTVSKYDHSTGNDIDIIQMQFRISGDNGPNPKVILDKTTATINKILDTHGELEPEKSTSVYAWADMNMGSQPPGYQIYFGEKEFFLSALEWTDGRFYKAGMRVQFEGGFFTAIQTHTAATANDPQNGIGTFWNVNTFTPSTNYSNWTKDKPQYWINSGFGYIHAGTFPKNNRACCYDHNLVIRDINHRRSWTDVNRGALSTIPSSMHLQGGGQEMYRTFRILLDQNANSIGAPFTQNGGRDRFNKLYVDSVVQHNGSTFTGTEEYKNWDVFLEPKNDMEILSTRDGICFVFNPCDALSFNNSCTGSRLPGWQQGAYEAIQISSLTITSFVPGLLPDCVHPYHINGTNDPEFGTAQGIESGIPGQNSAIRIQYLFTDSALAHGAWINLAWPIPRDGFASGPFLATVAGEKFINPSLDLNNMHLSSTGKRGLNQGSDSEGRGALEYGKINATRLYLKLEATALGGLIIPGGDFKYRLALFDSSDNVIVGDATITHNFNFSEIEIEITNFQIWRGRHGIPFTPLQEIEVLDIFETRNVVRMAISSLDSYDGDGRYVPINTYTKFTDGTFINLDGFHFVKPLSAMTQLETVQANKPAINFERDPLERGQISNYIQLRNDALSILELEQFKRVEYEINRPLRCDIKFGDEFTYINPRVVNDTDFGNAASIDLVCKKNIYIYSKKRGKTTKTIGVKRFKT